MTRLLPVLAGLLAAGGCYPRLPIDLGAPGDGGAIDGGATDGGGADGGGPDGGDTGPGVLDVEAVEPSDVPTSGGVAVEITGGPFDDSVQVLFGERGGELLTAERSWVEVVVPPSAGSATGPVDVTVRTDTALGVLEDGLVYWPDVNGKAQVIGAWVQQDPVGVTTAPTLFDAWVRLVEAADVDPVDRYGVDWGTCGPVTDGTGSVVGPEALQLGYAGDLLALTWSKERLEYTVEDIEALPMTEGADLDLAVPASGFSPDLQLPGVGRTPATLRLTTPDLGAGVPTLSSADATLTWAPGGYDYVLLSAGLGDVTLFVCPVPDTGRYTLSPSLLEGLDYSAKDGSAEIWLGAAGVVRADTELVHSNGEVRIDVGFGEVGQVRVERSGPGDGGAGLSPARQGRGR